MSLKLRVDSATTGEADLAIDAGTNALPLYESPDGIRGLYASDEADAELAALETAVAFSLLCDARADEADDVPEGASRRGYWADAFDELVDAADPPGPLGSRLWLLETAAATPANARRAEVYAGEALAWLRVGRFVTSLKVTGYAEGKRIMVGVDIRTRKGRRLTVELPVTHEPVQVFG